MKMMLQSTDAIPMNFGFTGKGNTAKPEGLKEVRKARTQRFQNVVEAGRHNVKERSLPV